MLEKFTIQKMASRLKTASFDHGEDDRWVPFEVPIRISLRRVLGNFRMHTGGRHRQELTQDNSVMSRR